MEINPLVPDEALLNERIKHLTLLYFSGKSSQAKSVLELYIVQSQVYISDAEKALNNQSMYDAKQALHRWRPSLPMVGLNELHDAVAHLEQQLALRAIASEVAHDTLDDIREANKTCCELINRVVLNLM